MKKEKNFVRENKILQFLVSFLLILVVLLGSEIFEQNKYDTLEMYLSNYYYSSDNIVKAITNKLGEDCEESSVEEVFLSLNFDNYIYKLVLEDINQYESNTLASYNMYLNSARAEEVLNVIEEKGDPKISLMEKNVCYINIPGFEKGGTYASIRKKEDLLKESRKFVVDLRENRGGNIDELIDVLSMFYDKGSIVYTSIGSKEVKEFKTKKEKLIEFDKIVFLCNENTASASEAMIFNMKSDFGDKVEIVGQKTYGKNFCYSYEEFDDGELFTFVSGFMGNAEGVTFNNDGIEPEYYAEGNECMNLALKLLEK